MPDSRVRRGTRREERRGLRDGLLVGGGGLAVLAMLPFGTVHPSWRLVLATASAVLGIVSVLARSRAGPVTGRALALAGLSLAAVVWASVTFVPVGPELRSALQPAVAGPVNDALAFAGVTRHPLALDPWRGLVEWSVLAGAVALALGTAELVRHRLRARRLALILVAGAVALAALGLAQRVTGAEHIYWISALPRPSPLLSEAQRRFFGTLVSPNHAGALLAAAVPLSVALLRQRGTTERAVGLFGLVWLWLGIAGTSSRGAVLEAVVALVVFAALASGRGGRVSLAVLLGLGATIVFWRGPQTVALDLTAVIDPIAARDVSEGWTDLSTGRAELYEDAWRLVADAPLVGVGPAGFDDAYRIVKTTPGFAVSDHAHQEALQVAAELGLPTLLLLLGALGVLAGGLPAALSEEHPVERRWLACGFAGTLSALLVAASFDFPFRAGALSTLTALAAGALLGLSAGRRPRGAAGSAPAWRVRLWTGSTLLAGGGALAAVAGAIVLGGSSGAFADADRLVARGDAAREQVDLAEAVTNYRAAVGAQPVRRDALQKLAAGLDQQGDRAAAAGALRIATEIYPSLPWPWRDLARLELRRGEVDASLVAWREMLSLDLPGEGAAARRMVAEALQAAADAGLPDPVSQALAVLPPRGDRWRDAASLAEAVGTRDDTAALYHEAIALDPGQRVAWAATLLRWGRVADALVVLDDARESGQDGCRAQLLRSEALWQRDGCGGQGERAEAARGLCMAGDVELRLAQARARVCDRDPRAVDVLERLLADEPGLDRARHLLVAELLERGRGGEAIVHLDLLEARGRLTEREEAQLVRLREGKPPLPAR